ncbi:sodium/bile acid cotransporter-like [Astatotilapia calliptera]|uniref:sodium/bile acid cotransporter-like n=1 Tax=Astatotilapia calliptera TaxID=8154 RepID=UPI000E40F55D|nr:sodium/bile acid cotransporter-like [Astatotilapia calliptera]
MNNTANLTSHQDLWRNVTIGNTTWVYRPAVNSALNDAISAVVIIIIIINMVSLGCTMEVSKIKYHLMKPKGVAIAVVSQYVIMPLTAFCLAKGFQLSDITAVSVLVCGCCPGGQFSNTLTLALKGDINLSIVMTSCSMLLAMGMMPLLLYIYCKGFPSVRNAVPYVQIILSLVLTLVPCGIGILINTYRPQYSKRVTKVGMIIMLIILVGTLSLIAIGSGHIILTMMSPSLLAIAGLMPLMGYCFGYVFSSIFRLIHRERRTVSMETGCQNVPLCTTILKVAFPDEVVGPLYLFPTVYLVSQLLEAAMIIMLFRCYQRFKRKEKETYQAAATGEDLKESDV